MHPASTLLQTAPRQARAMGGSYNPLGLFRLALALFVVVQHLAANASSSEVHDLLTPYEFGSIAVYVFFALSGFIIAEAARLSYADRPFAFLANRVLRIVPSYLVALAIAMVLVAVALSHTPVVIDGHAVEVGDLADPTVYLANILAIVPFLSPARLGWDVPLFIPIVWAIRVELLFYAVYFLAMLAAQRTGQPLARVLAVMGVAAVAISAVRFDAVTGMALENIPFFIVGLAAHHLLTRPRRLDAGSIAAGLFLMAGLGLSLARIWLRTDMIGDTGIARAFLPQVILFLALLALFWLLANLRLVPRGPVAVLDRRLGEYTYPIYLNHLVVVLLVGLFHAEPSLDVMVGAFLLSIAVPCLIAIPTEPWIGRLRDRVRGRRLG